MKIELVTIGFEINLQKEFLETFKINYYLILPACVNRAFLHPKFSIKYVEIGAMMKVPTPEPHRAIPVANGRHFSK